MGTKKMYSFYILIFTLGIIWLVSSFIFAEFLNPLDIMKIRPEGRGMLLLLFFGIYYFLFTIFSDDEEDKEENINE